MRLILGVLIVLSVKQFAFAQFGNTFKPTSYCDTIPNELLAILNSRLSADKNEIIGSSSKVNSFIKTVYDKRLEYIIKNFNDDYFLVDNDLTKQIESITDKIYKANPSFPRETRVFAHRSTSVNALSFGEGTIAIMIGLLERMENEDQVAFVLCHELAHYHYKHSYLRIKQLAELNYDKGLKKKIDEIQRNEYGRFTKMKELFEGLDLSFNKHSRGHEFEADSLGLLIYLKAKYDPKAPLRVMEILKSADKEVNPQPIHFKQLFNFKEYPFKESWINYQKSEVWHAPSDADSDTSRTHPNCDRRLEALHRQLQTLGYKIEDTQQTNPEKQMSSRSASFEVIESEYHYKNYGKAMYRSLQLINEYPDNAYLHAMVGKCLFKIYHAQKNHELGKHVSLPDPRFSDSYDRFLTFIHALRLTEIANIAYHYMTSQKIEFFEDEEFLYSLWLCSSLEISKVDADKVKMDYLDKFPSGRYSSIMKK